MRDFEDTHGPWLTLSSTAWAAFSAYAAQGAD
ncbi:hypothetical protein [Streptomyces viridosporus]